MSSSLIFAAKQITIYVGIPIVILGVIGNLFNVVIFLSLETFRKNSCAFCLTIMSIANVGQLLTVALSYIMSIAFNIDWRAVSVFYCKFSWFSVQFFGLSTFTCMCLAAVDQFFATCSNIRWQQWSNIKIAHRLMIGFTFIWLLHGVPYNMFYNLTVSSVSNQWQCTITNDIFQKYHVYGFLFILSSIIPISITALFGSLSYYNVQQLAHRTVPLVRREEEKQLSSLVFVHIIYNVLGTVPFIIRLVLVYIPEAGGSLSPAQIFFINNLALWLYFLNFSVS